MHIAVWLVDRFGLTVKDARGLNGMHAACTYGHLHIAVWLADRFGLVVEDAKSKIVTRGVTRKNGYPAIAAWVVARFAA